MSIVGRKGKLSISDSASELREVAWQRYEDVLTADVFGAYRYLPAQLGIVPAVKHAVDEQGQTLPDYLQRFGLTLEDLDVARIRFWPIFDDGCEPDVLVCLESSSTDQAVALLVEAKYHATQHVISGCSQLGHYLVQHLRDSYADGSVPWQLPEHPRPVVFVTRHDECPVKELAQARDEVCRTFEAVPSEDVGLFWLSWGTIGDEAKRQWDEHRQDVHRAPWLRHLLDLYEEIRIRDLLPRRPFAGIHPPPGLPSPRAYRQIYWDGVPACLRSLTTAITGYKRSYEFQPRRWSGFPTLYSNRGESR